jgi:hypothetical protein
MGTLKKGKQGTAMQGMDVSPARRKRQQKRRVKQEQGWARRSGAVKISSLDELSEDERRRMGL